MFDAIFSLASHQDGDVTTLTRDELGNFFLASDYVRKPVSVTEGQALDWLIHDCGLALEQAALALLFDPGAVVDFQEVGDFRIEVEEDEDGNCPF